MVPCSSSAINGPATVPRVPRRLGADFGPTNRGLPAHSSQPNQSASARALEFVSPAELFGSTRYNYQIPLLDATHQDAMQARLNKTLGQRNQLYGRFAFQNTASAARRTFSISSIPATCSESPPTSIGRTASARMYSPRQLLNSAACPPTTSHTSRTAKTFPAYAGISRQQSIACQLGPPSLSFSSGITGLSDGLPASNHNQTGSVSDSTSWIHGRHYLTLAAIFVASNSTILPSKTRVALLASQEQPPVPISQISLSGIPDTSAIAFGNADKYFRDSVYDAYVTDDWRVSPELTLNVGVRWEYSSPITELYGRLVNLDIAPGFTSVAPVVANAPSVPSPAFTIRPRSFIPINEASNPASASPGGHFPAHLSFSRRIRHLLQHVRLSKHRHANGPAIAALQELQRREQRRQPTHSCQRL